MFSFLLLAVYVPIKLAIRLGRGLTVFLQPSTLLEKVKIEEVAFYAQRTHVLFAEERYG